MYLYIYSSIKKPPPKHVWIHLIPMILWFVYCIWYYVQPMELKQLKFLMYHFPEGGLTFPDKPYHEDPLGLRDYILEMGGLFFTAYLIASIFLIKKTFKSLGLSFFTEKIKTIGWLRIFIFFMFAIMISVIISDLLFVADVGTFIIGSIISIVIYATSFNVIRASDFFQENVADPFQPKKKYKKSALQDEEKNLILTKLIQCMEVDKDFKNNLVSLPSIAKKLYSSVHHISQVINEKLDQTFFEMIASYRIEEAKSILGDSSQDHLTIEEIADEVGYNSKSAFNRSFKKIVGITPSEYKEKRNK